MFIATVFTIEQKWKPSRCPSAKEWINVVHVQWKTFSHRKKGILLFVTAHTELNSAMFCEMSGTPRLVKHKLIPMWNLKYPDLIDPESVMVVISSAGMMDGTELSHCY